MRFITDPETRRDLEKYGIKVSSVPKGTTPAGDENGSKPPEAVKTPSRPTRGIRSVDLAGIPAVMREAALEYARRVWPVVPVHTPGNGGLCTCGDMNCSSPGKHPRTPHGLKDATCDREQIKKWFARWEGANIGIATGKPSDMFVLDVDPRNGGDKTLEALEAEHGPLPETLRARTGGGGLHIFFKLPRGVVISNDNNGKLGPGLDVKGEGGYIVAPPSLHTSGNRYEWINPDAFPMDPPEWLLSLLNGSKPGHGAGKKSSFKLPDVIKGGARNTTLTSMAGKLRRSGMDEGEIYAALVSVNATRCRPPLGDDEVRRIAASVSRYEPAAGGDVDTDADYRLTDAGNSERLVRLYGDDIRHCATLKRWFVWDGRRWEPDVTHRMLDLATRTAKTIFQEAAVAENSEPFAKWALRSESLTGRRAMIDGAVFMVPVRFEELDAKPYLFNCENGTLDLLTGEFREHRREDLLTKMSGVRYDPGAKCPMWLDHLHTVFAGDEEMVGAFQMVLGYSLLQNNPEHLAFINWGNGKNGKSETMKVPARIMGEYAVNIEASTLMQSRHDTGGGARARPDVLRLRGARFVTVSEPDEQAVLSESLIKGVTGDHVVTARPLYAEPVEFRPGAKIFISTNYLPKIRGRDEGIWRRIWLFPYIVTIPTDKQVRDYGDRLYEQEASGIFNWMLSGLQRYQDRKKLEQPAAVKKATQKYRIEMNPIGRYIAEWCVCDPREKVGKGDLYTGYLEWCDETGWKPIGKKRFGQFVGTLFEDALVRAGGAVNRYWVGLRRKTKDEIENEDAPLHKQSGLDDHADQDCNICNTFAPKFPYDPEHEKVGANVLHVLQNEEPDKHTGEVNNKPLTDHADHRTDVTHTDAGEEKDQNNPDHEEAPPADAEDPRQDFDRWYPRVGFRSRPNPYEYRPIEGKTVGWCIVQGCLNHRDVKWVDRYGENPLCDRHYQEMKRHWDATHAGGDP